MTLRLRLTLLYASLLGGTLFLFGALVYSLINVVLLNQIDNLLLNQARAVAAVLKVNSFGQFDRVALDGFEPSDSNLVFQVWGTDRLLQYSRPRSWQQTLDTASRQAGRTVYRSTSSQGAHMRVLTIPLVTPRGPSGMLQVGVSLNLLDTTQSALATVLILLALVSMAFAALIASLAINRALAPLATATQIAATITKADDLSRRIPSEGTLDDEIGTLIQAFNETLSRLEGLFATQRRFVADVSHELRTPLTVIKGEVGLMRKMGASQAGFDEESLSSIEAEVDRLTRMVGNLLILAQAESGKLPLDLKAVELDTVLLEVFQQVRTLAGGKVTIQIGEIDQVAIQADRDRLKQVLLNIAGNAVQYTPASGTVRLSLKTVGERACVTIADSGPGIPAEDLPHIFERFYRGQKSRTRSQGSGFGLGLSIAYWIVRNHGGTIDVSSREGSGTSFIIWLPMKQAGEKNK
jgi:two-component system, OmpR family, sensor kinase